MQKQISIKISAVGKPTIEALNFQGQGCEAATKGLEAKLGGGVVADKEFKPEYAQADQTETQSMSW